MPSSCHHIGWWESLHDTLQKVGSPLVPSVLSSPSTSSLIFRLPLTHLKWHMGTNVARLLPTTEAVSINLCAGLSEICGRIGRPFKGKGKSRPSSKCQEATLRKIAERRKMQEIDIKSERSKARPNGKYCNQCAKLDQDVCGTRLLSLMTCEDCSGFSHTDAYGRRSARR